MTYFYMLLTGGTCCHERTQIDHWMLLSLSNTITEDYLKHLDIILVTCTWLVTKKMTLADIFVFSSLQKTDIAQYHNIIRWFKFIHSLPVVKEALILIIEQQAPFFSNPMKRLQYQGKFTDLPDAEWGKVKSYNIFK